MTLGEHTAGVRNRVAALLAQFCWHCLPWGSFTRLGTTPDAQHPPSRYCDGQPQSLGPFWVFHSRVLPLPASSLAVLEPLLDPAAQAVPGGIPLLHCQVAQDQPRFLVPLAPPAPQCALYSSLWRRERC